MMGSCYVAKGPNHCLFPSGKQSRPRLCGAWILVHRHFQSFSNSLKLLGE